MLRRLGYHADLAENGYRVLESLRQKLYDLVFMDVHMPELDGIETAKRIAAEWPPVTRPHIVALTASVFDENRALCLAAGMEGFLTKPAQLAELSRAITATSQAGHLPLRDPVGGA